MQAEMDEDIFIYVDRFYFIQQQYAHLISSDNGLLSSCWFTPNSLQTGSVQLRFGAKDLSE